MRACTFGGLASSGLRNCLATRRTGHRSFHSKFALASDVRDSNMADLRLHLSNALGSHLSSAPECFKICCKNLSDATTGEDLHDKFKDFGELDNAYVTKKLIGFVVFKQLTCAEDAMRHAKSRWPSGIFLHDKRVYVEWARDGTKGHERKRAVEQPAVAAVKRARRMSFEDQLRQQVWESLPPAGLQVGEVGQLLYGKWAPEEQKDDARSFMAEAGGLNAWLDSSSEFQIYKLGSSVWVQRMPVASLRSHSGDAENRASGDKEAEEAEAEWAVAEEDDEEVREIEAGASEEDDDAPLPAEACGYQLLLAAGTRTAAASAATAVDLSSTTSSKAIPSSGKARVDTSVRPSPPSIAAPPPQQPRVESHAAEACRKAEKEVDRLAEEPSLLPTDDSISTRRAVLRWLERRLLDNEKRDREEPSPPNAATSTAPAAVSTATSAVATADESAFERHVAVLEKEKRDLEAQLNAEQQEKRDLETQLDSELRGRERSFGHLQFALRFYLEQLVEEGGRGAREKWPNFIVRRELKVPALRKSDVGKTIDIGTTSAQTHSIGEVERVLASDAVVFTWQVATWGLKSRSSRARVAPPPSTGSSTGKPTSQSLKRARRSSKSMRQSAAR